MCERITYLVPATQCLVKQDNNECKAKNAVLTIYNDEGTS